MANITISTTEEEQRKVLLAIRKLAGETVAVSAIARKAGVNPNRCRYVITDLLEAGLISRTATKAFNKNYVRYAYDITTDGLKQFL